MSIAKDNVNWLLISIKVLGGVSWLLDPVGRVFLLEGRKNLDHLATA